jgi:hypothetical protein
MVSSDEQMKEDVSLASMNLSAVHGESPFPYANNT